jgi:Family of unknown function (DUF6152)
MPIRPFIVLLSSVAAATLAAGAAAHHSFTQFDRKSEIVTTGTVVRWEFNNPHSWLRMNVQNEDGSQTLWSFEGSGPTSLIQRGITGATFEPGDTVTLMYCRMVDGRPGGHMGWALLADGTFVNPSDGGCNGDDANIERWKGWLAQGYKSNKEAEAAE